jgi:RNA polymerase sigma-70 factor (ECF subfamily)
VADGSDNELAARAAAGCRASFASLIERQYERILRLAWRWSGSRTGAEDVTQDAVVKIASSIRHFRGECAVSTWIYRIVLTTAADHARAAQRVQPLAPSNLVMLIEARTEDTPESQVIDLELWQAVRTLPQQQRDAVLLVYAEDLSHAEAAEIMRCSEKTVSWHLHQARKRLKAHLEAVG